jgi:AcrR family transcriptional regulator
MAAADRRSAILEAARLAFAEGAYHEVSLGAVAERAGVSKALLYEHFDSKRDLYEAMLELHVRELIARISEAASAAEPGEARMRAGLEAFFALVEERRGSWRIMFRNIGDPGVAASLDRLREGVAAAIAALMTEDAEAAFPGEPELQRIVEMHAQQLMGAMQSLADWWDAHPDVPRSQVMRAAMDSAWIGHQRLITGERWSG